MTEISNEEILELDRQLCFKLYRVSRNMTKVYEPYLKEFDLTYPQYIVMLIMFQEKEIEFSLLSDKVDLSKATLSPIVNRLEAMGHIFKVPSENDKRKVIVTLSEKGIALKKEIISVPINMYGALGIKHESYLTLVKELDSLLEILKNSLKEKEKNDE